ncbi:hypothetical protein ACJMK2_038203 [Sinanodonta woodiana]|uniref:Peptidase M12B domain-containing protein n=1 Tax=Sinanodonta woodiana TaxID=1069815 RepID=A0ABD3WP90_SINWO
MNDERNIHPRRKRFWKAQYSDSKTEFDHRFPSSAFDTSLNKPQTVNFDEHDQSFLIFEESQRPRYVPGYPEEIPYLSEWSSNIDVDKSLLDDFREYEYLPSMHGAGKYSTKTNAVDYEFNDNIDKRREHQAIDATIEVFLVIDNAIYRKFLKSSKYQSSVASTKLQQYYSIVIAMVDQRYQTVKETNMSLRVKISGMYIAKTRMQASWIEYLVRYSDHVKQGTVNASRALRRFQKWLRSTKNLPSFDHAILITGYSLSKNNANVDGLAYVGTICKTADGKSSSIVHDEGDFQSVGVISHELGHSLGATHDGDDDNIDCPANGNYIMAPQNTNDIKTAAHLHYFSRCSIRQLRKVLLKESLAAKYARDYGVLTLPIHLCVELVRVW